MWQIGSQVARFFTERLAFEERHLTAMFKDAYVAYAASTPLRMPGVRAVVPYRPKGRDTHLWPIGATDVDAGVGR